VGITVKADGLVTPSGTELITYAFALASGKFNTLTMPQVLDLIHMASAHVEKYCRRPFAAVERTDILDGDGTVNLFLRAFPILQITSATIRDAAGNSVVYDPTKLICNDRTGELQLIPYALGAGDWSVFLNGFQNVTVIYTAGFDPIPAEVQAGVLHLMVWLRDNLDLNQMLQARRLGDYEERYKTAMQMVQVPSVVCQLLELYRLRGF